MTLTILWYCVRDNCPILSAEESMKCLEVLEVVGNLSNCLAQRLDVSGVMGRWVHSAGIH